MTPEQLLQLGYEKFNWNNGAVMEYWKPLEGKNKTATEQFERRLTVRFGEWKDRPFSVWLLTEVCGIECKNVHTIKQLEQLYEVVSWRVESGD